MAKRSRPRPPVSAPDAGAGPGETRFLLAGLVLIALTVRVVFSYSMVVKPDAVNFQDNDAWYHARAVEYQAANWPHQLRFDPFAISGGQTVPLAPMFDFIASTAAVVAGFGHPSQRTVEIVAAWTPAVLGALIVIPVYLAGRRLLDDRAGLLAAAFVAVFPGHYLERSRFGYLDHHVAEALFSTVALWLLIRALQTDDRRRPVAAVYAGLALGAYLLSWTTASYIVGILVAWIVIHYLVAALRGPGDAAPGIVVAVATAVALAVVLTLQNHRMYRFEFQVASLAIALATAVTLEALRRGIAAMQKPPWLLIVVSAALAVAAYLIADRMFPIVGGLRGEVMKAAPDPSAYTVVEAMPLWTYIHAPWITVRPYMVLGTGLPVGLAGLALFAVAAVREWKPDRTLLLTWTTVVLVSTLLRNRFAYYLVPLLAILAGWICSRAIERVSGSPRLKDLALVATGAVAFAPNIWPAYHQVRADLGMFQSWMEATDWLRRSTPEPFADPRFYFARYGTDVPEPRYSVMAWWDYGYWVMRRGRRVPVSNPTQLGASVAASFFINTDPAAAAKILDAVNARYVVVDSQLPFRFVAPPTYVLGKFQDLAIWAGKPASEFYEPVYTRDARGALQPAILFYPAYYQTMVNRLYQFGGRAVTPAPGWSAIATLEDRRFPDGTPFREVTAFKRFPNYPEAAAYLRSLGPGPHRLVGVQPAETPVPLEDLPNYSREFASPAIGPWPGSSAVYVFQFRR